ncbi:MAG: YggS family pyridoxal phosphate-dependent enzyme [Candidatus Aenigmarchaeota archaeon]|nr:YggS family pyridoxal phosphate-dependent enzyme [Candidatus Aenigmarchaeota archaeon]
MTIQENLKNVKERIRKSALKVNRNPEEIKLIAVTKTFDVDIIKKAFSLGITSIGETKVQEAREKQEKLGDISRKIEWHMIGNLQSNKAKDAAEIFDCIHSIDRIKIARKVSESCLRLNKKMPVLVQVNVSGITHGIKPEEAVDFIDEIKKLDGIQVKGLMTIAPLVEPEKTRPYFRKLRELAMAARLKQLSMGMSNDFELQ